MRLFAGEASFPISAAAFPGREFSGWVADLIFKGRLRSGAELSYADYRLRSQEINSH